MDVPVISAPMLRFFRKIVRGYFGRHFTAVRVSGRERFLPVESGEGPLVVYANHGSWWDPMVLILLAEELMPGRQHYAPMDAQALERYGILKRLGIFGVDPNSARGAVQFLRTSEAILKDGGVLWVTPQGKFVDARARPVVFKPGLAALAERVAPCRVLPLAIEYTFWDERLPECLLQLGEALEVAEGEAAASVEERMKAALTLAMDELKQKTLLRDGSLFETVLRGGVGTGGFYAAGQRAKAFVLRREYRPEHTAEKKQ